MEKTKITKVTKIAYWILSGIYILQMIVISIGSLTGRYSGTFDYFFELANSFSDPDVILGVGFIIVPQLILAFLISYIILFFKNLKAEEKKIVVILPLLICICFAFIPTLAVNIRTNNEKKIADKIILSAPVLVDLTEIGLGEYRKLSRHDFDKNFYNEDYIYDTSHKIENGTSPIYTACSYEDYMSIYRPKDFLNAEKYNYKGIEIYFLNEENGVEIYIMIRGSVYEIFSVYDSEFSSEEDKKEALYDLKRYDQILERVRNNPGFVPIKNEVEDVVKNMVKDIIDV